MVKEKQSPTPAEKSPEKPVEVKEKTPEVAAVVKPAVTTSPSPTVSTNTTTTTAQEQQSKVESNNSPQVTATQAPSPQLKAKEQVGYCAVLTTTGIL